MKEYTLFSGCMTSSRFPQFESSTIKVLKRLDIMLRPLRNWTCCPEPVSMQMLNPKAWYAIAARNICLAEKEGVDMVTLCSGCNATLFRANKGLKADHELRAEVNGYLEAVGKKFEGKTAVKSILRILYQDVGPEEIKKHVKTPLHSIKVAVHYGCHIFDELKEYDDVKKPKSLKDLVKALGAKVVDYPSETLCCAGYARSISEEVSLRIAEEKLNDLINADADCLILICPYCFLQFDLGQISIARKFKRSLQIPVLYYPQLLGLTMGFGAQDMGLQFHRIKTDGLIEKLGGVPIAVSS
ncbi:MAG: CoB--CoM heterodisulfide reductase iron-sulfur subunit B family protein [Candidatus Bathyarchaeia archaeon]